MTATSHPKPTPAPMEPDEHGQAGNTGLTETEQFIFEMLGRLDAAEAKAGNLHVALQHSRDIGAAIGILMAQHKVQQAEAFDRLSRCSQAQNRKVYDIALHVLTTGELPTVGSNDAPLGR